MNTLTPLNPDVKPEQLPESPKPVAPTQPATSMTDTPNYVDYNVPDIEVEQPIAQSYGAPGSQVPVSPATFTAPRPTQPAPSAFSGVAATAQTTAEPSSGFLVSYIASLFAGISMLYGLSTLGFALLDHFIKQPANMKIGSYFDASSLVSTWHVWLVASLLTFATLYLILSHVAGKRIAAGLVPERQLQASEVARSIFTAVLVITSAGLIASLLFTLLNGTLAAAEIKGEDIAIQISATIATFIWVAIIVWHQTAIHRRGRNGVPGAILMAGAIGIAVMASIFLLAAGRNAVIDSRTVSDLTTIQSELSSYKLDHDAYPETLSALAIDDEAVKGRLSKYTYTQTKSTAPSSLQQSFNSDDSSFSFSSGSGFNSSSSSNNLAASTSATSSYKLCANFLIDASSKSATAGLSSQSTSLTKTFLTHGKGQDCVESSL